MRTTVFQRILIASMLPLVFVFFMLFFTADNIVKEYGEDYAMDNVVLLARSVAERIRIGHSGAASDDALFPQLIGSQENAAFTRSITILLSGGEVLYPFEYAGDMLLDGGKLNHEDEIKKALAAGETYLDGSGFSSYYSESALFYFSPLTLEERNGQRLYVFLDIPVGPLYLDDAEASVQIFL
ncbi:MAG: hypothetical protein LBR85_00005, partial [Oscillospiraceae bacterium]|nr:hypothetical protein [Oscillospiraceae bacterium]